MAKKSKMSVDYKMISQNLNLLVAEMGISKADFMKRIGLTSTSTVSRRFKGHGWTLEEMTACSRLTGKSIEDIFLRKLITNVNKSE